MFFENLTVRTELRNLFTPLPFSFPLSIGPANRVGYFRPPVQTKCVGRIKSRRKSLHKWTKLWRELQQRERKREVTTLPSPSLSLLSEALLFVHLCNGFDQPCC